VIELPPTRNTVESIQIDYETKETAAALQWLAPNKAAGRRKPLAIHVVRADRRADLDPIAGHAAGARHLQGGDTHRPRHAGGHERRERFQGQTQRRVFVRHGAGDTVLFDCLGRRGPRIQGDGTAHRGVRREGHDQGGCQGIRRHRSDARGRREVVRAVSLGSASISWYLPPSFPVGGMENPRLCFISPTAIAGDKSLVSVVARELAHSWSGNLVTQATCATCGSTRGSRRICRAAS